MFPTRPRLAERSTCSSCGTPDCMTATRVSWGVQLMRMSSGMGGTGRASREDTTESEFLEELRGLVERQAHHAGVAAVELGDDRLPAALHDVPARLVARFAARDVGFDVGVRELGEAHPRLAQDELEALVELHRDRGEHAVLAPREQAQHLRR